jgi:signal peptidase I
MLTRTLVRNCEMENPPSPSSPIDSEQSPRPKLTGTIGRAAAAAGLSILFPGLGQTYNRQPRKGLVMAATIPLLATGLLETRTLFSFWGLVAFFFILAVWRLFIAAEAARVGWIGGKPEGRFDRPWLTTPILVVLVVLLGAFPTPGEFRSRYSYLAAFKVPSRSMCPTICPGERIVADMDAYHSRSPQRGELVLMEPPETQALLTKRVIGVAGDTIDAGPKNEVIVDGTPLSLPGTCGSPILEQNPSDDLPHFSSTTVSRLSWKWRMAFFR